MPYFFFKELPRHAGYDLILRVDTFEIAKQEQQELRRIEKLDGCAVHVVFAETEEEARQEHRKIYSYPEVKWLRATDKHA